MYHFFLVVLIFVSSILIFLIMIQKGNNIGTSCSTSSTEKLFTHSNRNRCITYITVFFAVLFFFISLVLSNVKINNHKMNFGSILNDK